MTVKLVLAPNALKGSLSAVEAAAMMARGARSIIPDAEIVSRPMSDGGDGFLEVMVNHYSADIIDASTTDPLDRRISAQWGWVESERLGIIEMARASGMAVLSKEELDPLAASSKGTGKLVRDALRHGARHILVGLGGTATVDGGMGIAEALGIRFFDNAGNLLSSRGANLAKINRFDAAPAVEMLQDIRIDLITDVNNPLLGRNGAVPVFAPQKGATPSQMDKLEHGMGNLSKVIYKMTGKDISQLRGTGAAGGTAGTLYALFGASIQPGAKFIAEMIGLKKAMINADLALTAEGKMDSQTLSGKAPAVVAEIAKNQNVPCVAIAGDIGEDWDNPTLFAQVYRLREKNMPLTVAITRAAELMEARTEKIVKELVQA